MASDKLSRLSCPKSGREEKAGPSAPTKLGSFMALLAIVSSPEWTQFEIYEYIKSNSMIKSGLQMI